MAFGILGIENPKAPRFNIRNAATKKAAEKCFPISRPVGAKHIEPGLARFIQGFIALLWMQEQGLQRPRVPGFVVVPGAL